MKKLLALAVAVLALVGCSGSSVQGSVKQAVGVKPSPIATVTPMIVPIHDCADRLADLFATNVSQGAYGCLSDNYQFQLGVGSGVVDDASLSSFFGQSQLYDAVKWTRPFPQSELDQIPPGETEEAYHLGPMSARGTSNYYKDGLGLKVFLDSSGKIVDIQVQ